jgi:hypothetical protein
MSFGSLGVLENRIVGFPAQDQLKKLEQPLS